MYGGAVGSTVASRKEGHKFNPDVSQPLSSCNNLTCFSASPDFLIQHHYHIFFIDTQRQCNSFHIFFLLTPPSTLSKQASHLKCTFSAWSQRQSCHIFIAWLIKLYHSVLQLCTSALLKISNSTLRLHSSGILLNNLVKKSTALSHGHLPMVSWPAVFPLFVDALTSSWPSWFTNCPPFILLLSSFISSSKYSICIPCTLFTCW